jgi:flagellar hook assembly protein FlgD
MTWTMTISPTPTGSVTPVPTQDTALALCSNQMNSRSGPPNCILYRVTDNVLVQVKVYNVIGVPVRRILDQAHAPGTYSVNWDGTDDYGQPLATGIYIIMMREGDREVHMKKVLVHDR